MVFFVTDFCRAAVQRALVLPPSISCSLILSVTTRHRAIFGAAPVRSIWRSTIMPNEEAPGGFAGLVADDVSPSGLLDKGETGHWRHLPPSQRAQIRR